MFFSTKKIGPISTSHRNWMAATNSNRDSVKCSVCHGYSRYIQFTFAGELDQHQWIYDFGDAKFIKQWLDDNWDHKTLVSENDPKLDKLKQAELDGLLYLTIIPSINDWGPGIEGSCKWVYDSLISTVLEKTDNRIWIAKVEIWEHENNSAFYVPDEI